MIKYYSFLKNMEDNKKTWEKPEINDLGDASDIIKNVFRVGTGDTEPGMVNVLASS